MTVRLVAIVGPTASGKTRLGVEVAHRLGSEIVSADSRQVYRGLDIGTGKDLDEYAAVDPPVRVHMLDVADPQEVYTLVRYLQDVRGVFAAAEGDPRFASGAVPLVMVGGSGLYVEAVLRGFQPAVVPPDPELRRRLEGEDHGVLVGELERLAPALAARTDTSSRRRVIRAHEILAAFDGREPPALSPVAPPPATVFGIDVDRDVLRDRIARRLQERLRDGMVDEVRGLLERGVEPDRLRALGLEYREITDHLVGGVAYADMVERLRVRIMRFAKRQWTWFRGMERRGVPIRWITPDDVDAVVDAARPT